MSDPRAGAGIAYGSDSGLERHGIEGAAESDAALNDRIVDAVRRDDGIAEATAISIELHNGVVTLTGQVDSEDQRVALESVIAAVPGVRSVANRVTLRPPGFD